MVLNLAALLNLPEKAQPMEILMQLFEVGKSFIWCMSSFFSSAPNPQRIYPLCMPDLGASKFSDFSVEFKAQLGFQVKITLSVVL